ncbi:MAG: UpxY family transcription antiterminator [Desulfobacterales bacterium]|nr:UpxY family transcription antiterminator [Desulfobacterales bacterium]
MQDREKKRSWYVLHTKSRFENVVDNGLTKKSIEGFLPRIKVRSRRKDRKLFIRVPLFSGYTFVKSDLSPHEHLEILKTAGVVRIIGNNDGPVPVIEEAVESLRIMVAAEEEVITGTRFQKGDKVMIACGPFTGIIGEFVQHRGKGRVIVNIEVLGQFAAIHVSEEDVEPLPKIYK